MKKNNIKIIGVSVVIILLLVALGPICIGEEKSDHNGIGKLASLQYEPKSHHFGNKLEGETDSTTFEIWRGGGCCTLIYELFENCDWVEVHPTSGSSNGEHDTITVNIDTAGLELGTHTCDIAIETNDCGSGVFTVTVNIVENTPPVLLYSPESYDFGDKVKGKTDSTTFEIWHSGYGTLSYTLTEDCSWVDVSPTSGTTQGEPDLITVSIDTTGLEPGLHTCDIAIESNGGNGKITATVTVSADFEIEIYGGVGIRAIIENTGEGDAIAVDWSVTFDGIILVPLSKEVLGTISSLPAGESEIVNIGLIFGIGRVMITVTAGTSEKSVNTIVLGFFVIIK